MASLVLTGDTSGQVTIAAPAVAGTTTLTLPATTGTVLNDATVGVCRAWVNFNGTGTVAIRASFNVTSITDNGSGDYSANFTTSISDVNYATVAIGQNASAPTIGTIPNVVTRAVGSVRVSFINVVETLRDGADQSIVVFR